MTVQKLLREPAVVEALGLSRSTLWVRIKHGLFPHPVRVGARSVAWPSREVEAVVAAHVAGSSEDKIHALVEQLHASRGQAAA
jgi:prophage regulatory protein